MPLIAAGVSTAVGAGANLYLGSKARKAQSAAMNEAMAFQQAQIDQAIKDLEAIGVPSVEAQKIAITQFAPELVGLEEKYSDVPEVKEVIKR
jgi:hypothetical protein